MVTMRHRALIRALALLAAAPAALPAQAAPPLAVGARVRVTAPDVGLRKRAGTVAAVRGDTLVLRTRDTGMAIPLARVERLEVSRGRGRGRAAALGAGLGLLAGAAAGAAHGQVGESVSCSWCLDAEFEAAVGAVAGLVIGTVVGARVGRERWERVPLPARGGSLRRRPGGLALAASLTF